MKLHRTRVGYETEDGRYAVTYGEAWTICEAPHPVPLPRSKWHEGWKADGTFGLIKGEVCGGGEEHPYGCWDVIEVASDRQISPQSFDRKRDAADWLESFLAKATS